MDAVVVILFLILPGGFYVGSLGTILLNPNAGEEHAQIHFTVIGLVCAAAIFYLTDSGFGFLRSVLVSVPGAAIAALPAATILKVRKNASMRRIAAELAEKERKQRAEKQAAERAEREQRERAEEEARQRLAIREEAETSAERQSIEDHVAMIVQSVRILKGAPDNTMVIQALDDELVRLSKLDVGKWSDENRRDFGISHDLFQKITVDDEIVKIHMREVFDSLNLTET